MASKTFASLFGLGDSVLSNHDRPYFNTLAKFNAVTAAPGHKAEVLGYPDAFPTLCAIISDDDPTSILLGSSSTLYRGIAGIASATDNRVVMFLGNLEEGVVPFVLPDDTFGCLSNADGVNVTIDTNAHHAAYAALGAGVNHILTIANNAASERVRPRRVIVLPPGLTATLVTKPNSHMSLKRFWTRVVQPLSTADPLRNKPIVDWWKAATTVNGPNHNMSIDTPQPPVTDLTFWGWLCRTESAIFSHVPTVNAPGLNQVAAPVSQVANQLHTTEQARVDEANASANMTFSQRFGTPLANLVLRFCRVGADANFPNDHQVCASNEKHSHDTANINICIYTQSLQTSYINTVNLPKVSPWMLEIFCQHNLVGNGMELGAGLNPFSVVCAGHHNTKDVLVLAERQATVEAGATVSLSDTLEFKTKDARFPKTFPPSLGQAMGLLSPLPRLLWGHARLVHRSTCFTTDRVPSHPEPGVCVRIQQEGRIAVLIAIRAMLGYQSRVQASLCSARATPTTDAVAAPDFSRILEAMESQTYDSLPRVPNQWMEIVKAQVVELWPVIKVPRIRGGGGGAGGGGMLPALAPQSQPWPHDSLEGSSRPGLQDHRRPQEPLEGIWRLCSPQGPRRK